MSKEVLGWLWSMFKIFTGFWLCEKNVINYRSGHKQLCLWAYTNQTKHLKNRWSEQHWRSSYTAMFFWIKPWVLVFMWMPFYMHDPFEHHCRMYTTSWQWPHPAGQCASTQRHNCSGRALRMRWRARPDLTKLHKSQSNWAFVGCARTSLIYGGYTKNQTWLWPTKAWK